MRHIQVQHFDCTQFPCLICEGGRYDGTGRDCVACGQAAAEQSAECPGITPDRIRRLHGLLILVEGIDGAGKTTFADALKRRLGMHVHVVDRFLGSCAVYDELLGRPAETRRDYAAELGRLCDAYVVRQIMIDCDPVVTWGRIVGRGEPRDPAEAGITTLRQAASLFEDWAKTCEAGVGVPTLWLDSGRYFSEALVERAAAWLLQE